MKTKKRCPTCGMINTPDMVLCEGCMADISAVLPSSTEDAVPATVSGVSQPIQFDEATRVESAPRLRFRSDNLTFEIRPDSILGRHGSGKEVFQNIPTVSRKHARITYEHETWFIEDLASANGVFVNGVQIAPNKPFQIQKGDRVTLSSKGTLIVEPGETS